MAHPAHKLRLLPPEDEVPAEAPKKAKRTSKVPTGLFRPQYSCKKCEVCLRKKAKTAAKGEHCLEPKTQKVWWYRTSIQGQRYQEPTGCTDLRSAQEKAAEMRLDWERQAAGLPPRKRLTLKKMLQGFRKFLATQKGSQEFIEIQMAHLEEVFAESAVRFADELSEEVLADWLPDADGRNLSARSRNIRVQALKRLGGWLQKKGLLRRDPFALLVPFDEKADRRHVRRAMWPGECEHFLRSVRKRPIEAARKHRRVSGLRRDELIYFRRAGRVRALVYNAVAQTGLRRNEVTLVRIQDVDFDAGVIWLPPKVAKSKREQYVRLNSDLARRLRAYIKTLGALEPESVLFPSTRKWGGKRAPKTAVPRSTTVDRDLAAAGLAKRDARDRVLDFHGLRMTYITHLRLAGVSLDMAKRLARHSDIRLTEEVYSDFNLLSDAEREAAEMLVPERRRQRFVPRVE